MYASMFALVLAIGAITVSAQGVTKFETLRDTLQKLAIDSSSHRIITNLVFEDGLITVSLDSGSFVYLERHDGRRVAALFRGTGTAMYTPNHLTEIVNLRRFMKADQFAEDFDRAIFIFTDNRLTSLVDEYPTSKDLPEGFGALRNEVHSFVSENDNQDLDGPLARCLLNAYSAPLFYCNAWFKKDMECILAHDPFDYEPFRLVARHAKKGPSSMTFINQCPDVNGWPPLADDGVDPFDQVSTEKHVMTCAIDRSLDLQATDRIDMTVRADSVRWLEMFLTGYLDVDSVFLDGKALTFFRAKESSRFWVRLPETFRKGRRFTLAVQYSGDIIERIRDYTILRTSLDWIPAHSYFHKALYDMTFSYPSSMTLLSLGKQESISTVDRTTTSRWVTAVPNTNNSFHIGLFRKRELKTTNETPSATMYYNTPDQVDAVALDIEQSLLFYTRLFGPLDIKHLNATELPGSHGEAFPGLLHLSTYAFYLSSDAKTDDFFGEQFTSHEVAHQWWGISVKPKTYRDRWISEGFAMYSCLLYSQLAAQEGDKFFRLLDEYRDQIIGFGKKAIGENLPPPPVDLGHRVSNGAGMSAGAYNAFVYYKGAWVLHMLRNMMLDMRTMKEDAFMTVMKEFYTRYNGKRASTEDFRKVIQEVTGADLGWFFDQWVYSNEVPTYRVAWKKTQLPGGQWKVTLRVKQEGVSENFAMLVPVKIMDEDGKAVRLRLNVVGAQSEVDLPHVNFEPDDVVFNDLESVLCEVKTEGF